ncbi:MAG: heavy metal translocating P-type ATPase [Bacilli bacterium]|jgi:Cd2+/Zn2+-exporting ATPase
MKRIYDISGMHCANCAYNLERGLSKDSNVANVSVDFTSSRLYIEYKKHPYSDEELQKKVSSIDSDFVIRNNSEPAKTTSVFTKDLWILLARIIGSSFLLVLAVFIQYVFAPELNYVYIPIYCVGLAIVIYDIAWKVLKKIIHFQNPVDMNLLLTIAGIGSFCLVFFGHPSFFEGVLVIVLYQVGEILESVATNKSKKAIQNAVDLRADRANLITKNGIKVVHPKDLIIGEKILVKIGEIIPIDGEVVEGYGIVDTSSLTGEFVPSNAEKGYKALSGCILKSGSLTIAVKKSFKDSTASKILELVTSSGERKSKAEKFINRFARIYTPAVFSIAVIIAIVPLFLAIAPNSVVDALVWEEWIYRALCFVVIGCPCAIVISVPLAYFSGIGLASKNNIVVKGANYLDELCSVERVVFDKTGTLTKGNFSIKKQEIIKGISGEEFNEYLTAAESRSNHPIAKAITYGSDISSFSSQIEKYDEEAGKGITVFYKKKSVLAGNFDYMRNNGIALEQSSEVGTIVYLAVNHVFFGYVVLDDTIKENSKRMIDYLSRNDIESMMLTGDNKKHAEYVADELGIRRYYAELLPNQKTEILENVIASSKKSVVFVGDGINDAPSIIRSDIGIAMGGIGSDVAVDNADVVIMNDDPIKIADILSIAYFTRRKAIFNIVFALAVKLTLMILSFFDLVPMWGAVLADTGLTCLLVINSLLLLYKKIKN